MFVNLRNAGDLKIGPRQVVNGMDASALDLLAATLIYEPSKRMSAKTAMQHRYFDDLDKNAVVNRGIVNQ